MNYKGKKVVVMGLGLNSGGLSAAKYFAKQNAKVLVTDLKPKETFHKELQELQEFTNIEYIFDEHREEDFKNADLIIRNPSVPKESKYLQIAKDAGVEIQMIEGIFFKNCPSKNIIGITGTKGKTTTTYLIYEVLKANGLRVHIAGNLQISVLEVLHKVKKDDWVVLELSSWQCEALDDLQVSPKIGIITNIYEDHLNRYPSYEAYAMSKASIFKYSGNEVFITIKGGEFTKEYLKLSKSKNILIDPAKAVRYTDLFSKIRLKGNHNKMNILFALTVSENLQLDVDKTSQALAVFEGVPYRMQSIGKIGEVEFINDTTATAPIAALQAMKTYGKDAVYIVGGADKNMDFSDMAKYVLDNNFEYVIDRGTAADKLIEHGLSGEVFDDYEQMIKKAFEMAKPNKKVVLAPGGTSFNVFNNEFERGDKFNKIFAKLKDEN